MANKTYMKGDKILAHNKRTQESYKFTCPKDNMCAKMLRRYIIINKSDEMLACDKYDDFIFIKQ
jgi:hypothetical protein